MERCPVCDAEEREQGNHVYWQAFMFCVECWKMLFPTPSHLEMTFSQLLRRIADERDRVQKLKLAGADCGRPTK